MIIKTENALSMFCPLKNGPCVGTLCMAWVAMKTDNTTPSRGYCGMVPPTELDVSAKIE